MSAAEAFEQGEALRSAGDVRGAAAAYRRALAIDAKHAGAVHGMARLAETRRDWPAALEFSRIAVALDPFRAAFHLAEADVQRQIGALAEAIDAYGRAVNLDPALGEAWYGRAACLGVLGRAAESNADYRRALEVSPALSQLDLERLFDILKTCDWTRYDDLVARAAAAADGGQQMAEPFAFTAVNTSPARQLAVSREYAQRLHPPLEPLWRGEAYDHARIRLGYVSGDWHGHPVSHLTAGYYGRHDRSRFEVIAFSYGPRAKSPIRDRVMAGFDQFIDVPVTDEAAIAQMMRAMEIDILIDLKGYTTDALPSLFARRPAPLQVNYLGFPGTLGTPYHDYIIGDAQLIPRTDDPFHTEAVVRLPDTYMPTDRDMAIADHTPTRTQAGLPDEAFVFCAFNNAYKLSPMMFGAWMRILRAVPSSVLWLTASGAAPINLRREAVARGVDPDRLIFAPFAERREDHLARHRLADLYLDNLPFNGHTSGVDALWAGLPVLTCRGPTFVGRVGASLLTATGLPELITDDLAQYETTAITLAGDPPRLQHIRDRLIAGRTTCALFDTDRYCRQMEAAFATMHQRHIAGLPPASFDVPSLDSPA